MAKEFKKPILAIGLRYDRDLKDANKILSVKPKVTTSLRYCDAVSENLTHGVFCTYKMVLLPEPALTRDAAVEAALKMDVFSRDDHRAFRKWLTTQEDTAKPAAPKARKAPKSDGDAETTSKNLMAELQDVVAKGKGKTTEKSNSEVTTESEPA